MSDAAPISPAPFSTAKLAPELLEVVADLKYTSMTPIQAQSIPVLLAGRDLIGQSKTGSGKTAAFTLPILQKLSTAKLDLQRNVKVHALVLCPTRELCSQVMREVRKLGTKHIGLRVLLLAGGQPIGPQLRALESGVHIVVGTPGRVLDHLLKRSLDLSTVTDFVLDEADRMLDMGFSDEMNEIAEYLPADRQTALFSATFPKAIEDIARRYLKNPERVTIENEARATTVAQVYLEVPGDYKEEEKLFQDKLKTLLWTLAYHEPLVSIAFCNFKVTVAKLAASLRTHGVSAAGLHGDLEQSERDGMMAKFRNGSIRVLIATDVAARGIDIPDLDLVVNFEIPKHTDTYVHRIGRTGRAGKKGNAVTLILPKEVDRISHFISETDQPIDKLEPEDSISELTIFEIESELHQEALVETLFISGGRKNKIRPGDILGALTGDAAGLEGSAIGKIEIHDYFSYVAIKKSVSRIALTRLREGRIKGAKFRVEIAK
jgi:ATP-independent RNA helicase DbpA